MTDGDLASGVSSCPFNNAHSTTCEPPPREQEHPCDAYELGISAPDQGGSETLFMASTRLRRLDPPPEAPGRLHRELREYDLVIETVAGEPGREVGAQQIGPEGSAPARGSASAPPAWIRAQGSWRGGCGDRAHRTLHYTPDRAAAQQPGNQQRIQVYSRPLPTLWHPIELFRALTNHQNLVGRHVWEVRSCGAPASGLAVGGLRALVLTHPKDIMGFTVTYAPQGWGQTQWSNTQAAADREAAAGQRQALALQVQQIPGPRRPHRGAAAGVWRNFEARQREARGRREAARQAVRDHDARTAAGRVQDPSGATRRIGVTVNDDCLIDMKLIYNDRELAITEMAEINRTLQRIRAAGNSLQQVFAWIQTLTPAPVQPRVGVTLKVLNGELTFASGHFTEITQSRFQTVEREVYLAANVILLGAEGTAAIAVGRMVLGTGVEATVGITLSGSIGAAFEGVFAIPFRSSIQVQGELGLAAFGDFRATAAYYDIISASLEARVRVTVGSTFAISGSAQPSPLSWTVPPVTVTLNYRSQATGHSDSIVTEVTSQRTGQIRLRA